MALYTVGHGARTTDELVAVLDASGVRRLIDVRRFPGSRRHSHLGRAELEVSLPELGVAYVWRGEELGGMRRPVEPSNHPEWRDPGFRAYADYMDTAPFAAALRVLLDDVSADPPLAIMCAETLWWRCHRRMIADAAAAQGIEVIHLLDVGKTQAHPHELAL
jgi:uncharacterized protein (DUF488 family)